MRRHSHPHYITEWKCKFISIATKKICKDVFIWIPPDDPTRMTCIDCAWKANDTGIYLDTRGCNQDRPIWVKQYDWSKIRGSTMEVEEARAPMEVDTAGSSVESKIENPSKRPKLDHTEL